MPAYTRQDLRIMQDWPLEQKIRVTQAKILEWYHHYGGNVAVSFSGGKDSTVLLDLVRRAFPDVPAVFVDTGLEYPEIREFVKTVPNVTWLRPEIPFSKVLTTYGYPIISKDVARRIYYARQGSPWAIRHLNGLNADGTPSKFNERYMKWRVLLDAPFLISDKCCSVMKERPLHQYARENKRYMIVGTMASESVRRQSSYLKTGCNAYNKRDPTSQPLSFWTEQDILAYLKMTDIPYASIYGEIIEKNGKLTTTGVKRSGCMFCMFGIQLEVEPNRFQRMEVTHPKQYDFCIHKLGYGDVLDYLNIPYTAKEKMPSMENEKDYQPDILKFLEKIVQRNTIAYKEDFDVDKEILWNSAQESSLEHRSFLWMSRPCGTWCVPERETYLQDSRAYKTWTFYADQPNGIKAYRVVVDGVRDGKLAGKIVPVNYAKQVQRVVKSALPIEKVQYRDRDDYFCESSYETFIHDVSRTEEKIHDIRYVPKSEAELQSLLMLEHQLEQQDRRPKRTKSVTKQPDTR